MAHGLLRTRVAVREVMPGIVAGQFELDPGSERLQINGVRALGLLDGYLVETNTTSTTIRVAFAGTAVLSGAGDLVEIEIGAGTETAVDKALARARILSARLNEQVVIKAVSSRPDKFEPSAPASTLLTIRHRGDNAVVGIGVGNAGRIRIAHYDVRGRRIGVVADRAFSAGTHTVEWNTGASASGMYVLRVWGAGAGRGEVIPAALTR